MTLSGLSSARPHLKQSIADRFWSKVDVRGDSECWPWRAARLPQRGNMCGGYGRFAVKKGDIQYAHRVAYVLSCGDIPSGMYVLHTCDNPPCCNPKHLRLGTAADNAADRDARGRSVMGRVYRGAEHANAKLTPEQVLELRADRGASRLTHRQWAKKLGVSVSTVRRARATTHYRNVKAKP